MLPSKKYLASKTFWFNVLALIGVVATGFGFDVFEPDAKVFEYGAALITLINVGLRFATKKPIKL
jgi:hypothetical protein